jgi:hypothetical protein
MMSEIVEFVHEKNKEWASTLSPKNIGDILNAVSLVPNIMNNEIPLERFAANIGKEGEANFENIIDQCLSNEYKMENMSKTSRSGDFYLSWNSSKTNKIYKILIDVKKYATTVPSKEVIKFYRDLNVNNIGGGLFLSLTSKICGISKTIELKNHQKDNGQIVSCIFAHASEPLLIAEIIKLLFHVMEIKDLNINEVDDMNVLYGQINKLNENIEMITECRDVLQTSKINIEKELNNIMYKLMNCEYNLISRVSAINNSLVNKHELEHTISNEELYSDIDDSLNMVNMVISTFKSIISDEIIPYLYSIYNIGWDNSVINLPKKMWILSNKNISLTIKILKSATSVILYEITEPIQKIIVAMAKNKKYVRTTSAGVVIKIDAETIGDILKICELFK